jgi:iron complex outermembrane receptor protein
MHMFDVKRPMPFRAGAVALGLLFSGSTFAQTQTQTKSGSSSEPELQEIVVTGSLIKRTDTETPSPVQVITADDLKNSGYTNVSDVIRNLAATGMGTLNQNFDQAFASGGSGVALRGLTVGDTLTLIDGERMVAYPLSDDGQRSFVDITDIPFNAIDTVEVLKDGASAIYGADAIAGVVNIKLKKTYVGSDFVVEGGTTQHGDGTTEHLSGIMGFGDLSNDGYNVYVAVDFHHTDKIDASSRSGAFTNLDWSDLPGGLNTMPGAPGAHNATYPESLTGYLVNPNTSTGQPYAFLPGCTQALQSADKCTFTFPGLIQTPSEQTDVLSKFTKSLANDWSLTVTGSVFNSVAEQVSPQGTSNAYATTGINQGSIVNVAFSPGKGPFAVPYPVYSLPGSSPLNPFGVAADLVYSFPDLGPFLTDVDTTTYRLYTDVKGAAGGWDLDGAVGLMYSSEREKYSGLFEPGLVQAALNSGAYVPGVSTNGAALFAPQADTTMSSTLDVVEFHGSRELAQLDGGPLALAAGAQYFHKAQNAQQPTSISSGLQIGTTAFTVGSQDDTAAFVELQAQPVKQLELNGAVRYDHYDTYGGSATPKFGFKFTPVNEFAVRGTWGKGFRAPSISESGNAGIAFGEANTFDPILCPGGVANVKGTFNALCSYAGTGVEPGNPALKAVTSTNFTFGVIFEPSQAFNVSVDYYRIELKNDIWSAAGLGGLGNNIGTVRGAPAQLAVCTATVTTGTCPQQIVTTPVGFPNYLIVPYLNAADTKTAGIDVDLRSRFELGDFGKLTTELNYTYVQQYEIETEGITYDLAGTHGPSSVSGDTGNPKQRATASLTWQGGPATATVSVNYTGSFSVTDPSGGQDTCLEALQDRGDSAYGPAISPTVHTLASAWYPYCSVHHFTDVNLYASYAATDHLSVHAAITNLFNTQPPVDLATYGGAGGLAYDSALHQDGAVGRFFLIGANLKF